MLPPHRLLARVVATLVLSVYLVWVFRHFRTTFTVHHPLGIPKAAFLALPPRLAKFMEFAAEETVNVVDPANGKRLDKVRILAPFRDMTQFELAYTDCRALGLEAPVRISGDSRNTRTPFVIEGPAGTVRVEDGAIRAWRHIHMPGNEHMDRCGGQANTWASRPRWQGSAPSPVAESRIWQSLPPRSWGLHHSRRPPGPTCAAGGGTHTPLHHVSPPSALLPYPLSLPTSQL